MSIQNGVGVMALGALTYFISSPVEMVSPTTSHYMRMAGIASMCLGGKMIWDKAVPLISRVGEIKERIMESKIPTPQAIAACALSYSLPYATESATTAVVAIGSGVYLYRSLPSLEEAAERLNGYSTDHPLHIDSPFDVKLEQIHFEFDSIGAAYLGSQIEPKYATAANLQGRSAEKILAMIEQHPEMRKPSWKEPSDAFKEDTMKVLLKHKFGIDTHLSEMTEPQKKCRASLVAANGEGFKHPSVRGFTADQMNRFLRECYDQVVSD